MKKKNLLLIIVSIILFLGVQNLHAQEKESKSQLWLVQEMVVKPSMADQHRSLVKEYIELCKKHSLSYTWYANHNGNFHYYYFYPVNDYNEINAIHEESAPIHKEFGNDNWKAWNETYNSYKYYYLESSSNLSYIPKNPRLKNDENNYAKWHLYYTIPGKGSEFKKLFKEFITLLESKKYSNSLNFGWGDVGVEGSLYIVYSSGKSSVDQIEQSNKMWKLIGEEGWKIYEKAIALTRKLETLELWDLKDLSYSPKKEE